MPLGIGYIASQLIQKNLVRENDIRIVDSKKAAIEFKPDILGVGSVTQVVGDARQIARQCKKANGCLTVLGGYHITCIPRSLPEEFDIGVIGEGELTFAELVEKFTKGELTRKDLIKIRGICYHEDDKTVRTPPRGFIADIDSIPWPYRHRRYSSDEPVFTSRGCPFHCTYCASRTFWGDKVRFRSADSVVNEISYLVDSRQPKEIAILDDLWMAHKERFREIVTKLVERGIPEKVSFRGFCRSNIVNEETILLFKDLNYRFVRFGAETGSERLLKKIKGRGISVADHQRVIDLSFKHGLKCSASFMFGVPGETITDIKLTEAFLRKNRCKFGISGLYLFNPMPGTVLWRELLKKGKVSENLDFERYQLDFLNPRFSWDDILYFNEENIPLKQFQAIIESIKAEFIPWAAKKPLLKKIIPYLRKQHRKLKSIFKSALMQTL
ncbi:MAG: hypothetical protein BBJ57_10860 [Desulfobacterales bacterium PC51MH44]|nr:MAG: hypothetical protein BBJ57_10860 [Desulfobacterales bacterium PC51MH44]